MATEFIFSEKGNSELSWDEYVYCNCPACVHTEADSVVKHVGDQSHAPDVVSVEAA